MLVYRSTVQSTSMRLQAGYLNRSGDDALLPPVTRDESSLLTPYNTAYLILRAWQAQDWTSLYDLTAKEGETAEKTRVGEQSAFDAFSAARLLAEFELSPGAVSFDGQTAVLTAKLTVQDQGADQTVQGYPVLLRREAGIWKMDYTRLLSMMNGNL